MRLPTIAAILIALPLAAHAEPKVERVDVLETGTFTTETGEATADPNAPGGETVPVTRATLITAGTTVPAALGTDFGFRYVVVGAPEGEKVALDFVVTAPEPGLADPEASEPIHTVRFTREKTIGVPDYLGYYLEAPWETVPGDWHFEIWQGERKLAGQTFTLTPAE